MGQALEIAKVLVSPTEKLIDVISNGIGVVYEPRHRRKMADATAYEINQIGEAVRSNSDVIISYKDGSTEIELPNFNDFVERANYRLTYQELLKQRNIESVLDKTYTALECTDAVVADPVCVDWISSFFDFVANVSDSEMQVLWSKLLQGEISCPGSFSIRTLDLLRKMTTYEANIFKKVVPYILKGTDSNSFDGNAFYLLDDISEHKPELTFGDIGILKAAGIISYDSIAFNCILQPNETEAIENLNKKITIKNIGNNEIKITNGVYVLTEFGRDLYKITLASEKFNGDAEYLELCLKTILNYDSFFNPLEEEDIENLECEIL